jgi:hypothetical protein
MHENEVKWAFQHASQKSVSIPYPVPSDKALLPFQDLDQNCVASSYLNWIQKQLYRL